MSSSTAGLRVSRVHRVNATGTVRDKTDSLSLFVRGHHTEFGIVLSNRGMAT